MSKLKKTLILLFTLIIIIAIGGMVFADNGSSQRSISALEKEETLDKSGFFAGDLVRVEGTVDGAVFAVGNEVRITGNINGDLFVVARRLYVDGDVKGNVYGIGATTNTNAEIEKDAFIGGWDITIGENAAINRDLVAVGRSVVCDGAVRRNFTGAGVKVAINGIVGQSENPEENSPDTQSMGHTIGDSKIIEKSGIYTVSNLSYDGALKEISAAPKSTIVVDTLKEEFSNIAGALLIWGIVVFWRPRFWSETARVLKEHPLRAFGIGFVALIIVPILSTVLLFTGFGVPLGLIMGTIYGIAIYISKLIVATFLGYWILSKFKLMEIHRGIWAFLLGLVIITILSIPQVPLLEYGVGFLTICFGIGTLVLAKYKAE